jgi:uncharacterized membrane protein
MEIFLIFLILGLLIHQHIKVKALFEEQRNDLFKMEGRLIARIKEQEKSAAPKSESKVSEVVQAPEVVKPAEPIEVYLEQEMAPTSLEIISEDSWPYEPITTNTNESEEEVRPIEVEQHAPAEPVVPELGWWEKFKGEHSDWERFIGENLISKIGITLLVLGVAYFVKLAIDQNWINEIARAGIGILAGTAVLGFAHYLRAQYKAFSSVLVAGGISIYYFTLTIAFQDYHLFSQTFAFIFLCIVTIFSILISLSYNRQELAILSLIGGFASPLMISTGEGNYIVLFSYLLVLNASLLVIAYFRNWNILNAITFGLTVLMFGTWLQQKLMPLAGDANAPYLGALLFASAFYLVFTFSNLINQIKEKQAFKTLELSLIVSNSFLFFAAGFSILNIFAPNFKGAFSIVLAVFNLLVTYYVVKLQRVDKNLFYLLVGLTLTFITLAIPIQFSGNYITLFWAVEACLLLWLSQKSSISLYRFVSLLVLVLSVCSLVIDWNQIYAQRQDLWIVANPAFVTSLLVALSMLYYVKLLAKDTEESYEFFGVVWPQSTIKRAVSFMLVPMTYLSGILEWHYHFNQLFELNIQVNAFNLFYHLLFSTGIIIWLNNKVDKDYNLFKFALAIVNVVLFIACFSFAFTQEIYWIIESGVPQTSYMYWIHWLCYIPVVYQLKLSYAYAKLNWPKPTAWVFIATLTLILSKEIQWQVLMVNQSSLLTNVYWFEQIEDLLKATSKVAYPILWGLIAFICLSFGIRNSYKQLRIASLTLIGITILKLFVYDISNVSETGKIIAFILLGLVLLIISFTYQKIKAILLDGEENSKEDETP